MPSLILSSILLYHIPDENWAMYASMLDILHNGLYVASVFYPYTTFYYAIFIAERLNP